MLAGARLKRLQGRELAVGLGGLLAGVVVSAALMQPQLPERPKVQSPQAPAAPVQASEKAENVSVPVKIVGPSAEGRIACADQTWPYIERRCLTEAPPRVVEQAPRPAVTIAAPAMPTVVAEPVTPPVETTGVAAAREAEITPAVAQSKAAPEAIETNKVSKSEQRRIERQLRREAEDRKREAEALKRKELARKEEADNDERIKRVAAERPARERAPVKRWRELVYDYPDGSRRRVILNGSRSAAATYGDD